MVALASSLPDGSASRSPDDVRRLFWEGECAMAITWPTPAADLPSEGGRGDVTILPLPGAQDVYNIESQAWEKRRSGRPVSVPLLQPTGRSGSVTANCRWPQAAAELLLWLSGSEWGRQVSGASTHCAPSMCTRGATEWAQPTTS